MGVTLPHLSRSEMIPSGDGSMESGFIFGTLSYQALPLKAQGGRSPPWFQMRKLKLREQTVQCTGLAGG